MKLKTFTFLRRALLRRVAVPAVAVEYVGRVVSVSDGAILTPC